MLLILILLILLILLFRNLNMEIGILGSEATCQRKQGHRHKGRGIPPPPSRGGDGGRRKRQTVSFFSLPPLSASPPVLDPPPDLLRREPDLVGEAQPVLPPVVGSQKVQPPLKHPVDLGTFKNRNIKLAWAGQIMLKPAGSSL